MDSLLMFGFEPELSKDCNSEYKYDEIPSNLVTSILKSTGILVFFNTNSLSKFLNLPSVDSSSSPSALSIISNGLILFNLLFFLSRSDAAASSSSSLCLFLLIRTSSSIYITEGRLFVRD